MLDLARADAEGERAERAVGGGVAVPADDRHAWLGEAELRTDDVDDPLTGVVHRVQPDTEVGAVLAQGLDLGGRDRVRDRAQRVDGRDVVVLGGDGEIRAAQRSTGQSERLESLRAGHLVYEMQVDVEQVGFAVGTPDDVSVPDLLRECAPHGPLLQMIARSDGHCTLIVLDFLYSGMTVSAYGTA